MVRTVCILLLFFFAWPGVPEAGDLFLCRNVFIPPHPSRDQIEGLKNKACRLFRPGDQIVAFYFFRQKGTENLVEFKWKRRLGRNTRLEEKSYLHRIEQKSPGAQYLSFAWLSPPPSLLDIALGSRYAGDWLVEVHINGEQVAEASFTIK